MLENFDKLKKEVFMFIDLIDSIAVEDNNRKLREVLVTMRNELDAVRYSIAIIGFMKRGKSTLINVMLRQRNDDISPVKVEPCTAAIIRYQHTDRDEEKGKAHVHFKDMDKKPMDVSRTQIRDYVDNRHNPDNSKGVGYIDVMDNFPILNAAMLVDTPGKGSIHGEHDILTDEFLPFADAIILPISADLPIEAGEKEFLKDLSKKEKDHIFVVLTKADTMSENDKAEVDIWVKRQLAEAEISFDRLYYTAAKPVFKALKGGAGDDEVKVLADESGITELENEIEKHILGKSDKNRLLSHRFQQIMDLGNSYYNEGIQNVRRELGLFNMNYSELLSEQKSNEDKRDALRNSRDKQLKVFMRDWDKHVDRFKVTLEGKADSIVDRLSERLVKDGLFSAVQRRPIKLVANAVEEETRKVVSDLINNLDATVAKLSEDLTADLDVYVGRKQSMDKIAAISGISVCIGIGGGITATAGHVAATAGAISSAWSGYAGAAQGVGLVAKGWSVLWGAGASASVATANTAYAAALTTTIAGVISAGMAIGAMWIVAELVKCVLTGTQKSRLPSLTAEALKAMAQGVCASLQLNRDLLVTEFTEAIEEQINYTETRLTEIAEAVKQQDPMKKIALEEHRDKLVALQISHDDLRKQLCLLIE